MGLCTWIELPRSITDDERTQKREILISLGRRVAPSSHCLLRRAVLPHIWGKALSLSLLKPLCPETSHQCSFSPRPLPHLHPQLLPRRAERGRHLPLVESARRPLYKPSPSLFWQACWNNDYPVNTRCAEVAIVQSKAMVCTGAKLC